MKKKFFQLFFVSMVFLLGNCVYLYAQVTIGALDEPKATLDVTATFLVDNAPAGIIPPRIERLALNTYEAKYGPNQNGAIVYVTVLNDIAQNKTVNVTTTGLYYFDGSLWQPVGGGSNQQEWFFMPSIVIDVSTDGTFSRDLYLEYKKQFTDTENSTTNTYSPVPGNLLVKSDNNAPNPFTKIYSAGELYYYVIGYDAEVFSDLSISTNGLLAYTVDSEKVSSSTYMNIVFVVK